MGRSRRDLTRRRLLQWGVGGFASLYGAKELVWDHVWESVAEAAESPMQNCLVLLYLAGVNDGLNVVLPNGTDDATAQANYRAYADEQPALRRGFGATAGGVVGSRALTAPGAAAQLA